MKRETWEYIETNLDPQGLILEEFLADEEAQEDIVEYAKAIVAELDDAFADEGGAGVSVNDMTNYLWAAAEKQNSERN